MKARLAAALTLAVILSTPLFAQGVLFKATILDPLGARLADVRVVLTNAQTGTVTVGRTTDGGTIELTVPPGSYLVETSLPGFRMLQRSVEVTASSAPRTFTLLVGELEETLQIVGTRGQRGATSRVVDFPDARASVPQMIAACGQAAGGDVPRGGSIRPPRKLRDVRPPYPQAALDSGVGGTVVLSALIDAGGEVRDVRNASPLAHPDLVAAGIDAVRGWVFSPTLLNCVPIEVEMHVVLQFDVR